MSFFSINFNFSLDFCGLHRCICIDLSLGISLSYGLYLTVPIKDQLKRDKLICRRALILAHGVLLAHCRLVRTNNFIVNNNVAAFCGHGFILFDNNGVVLQAGFVSLFVERDKS